MSNRKLFSIVAVLVTIFATLGSLANPVEADAATNCSLSAKLVPSCGVMTGAYVQPRSGENAESAFARFEKQVGKKEDIVHYYHQGSDLFPTAWEIARAKSGQKLLLSWRPEQGHTWAQVASGAVDKYIDAEAAYIKSHYTDPFYMVIHHEPEEEVKPTAGSGYTATDYRNMYRHVVSRLRSQGVNNVIFVACFMGTQVYVTKPWFNDLWPGDGYVDWIAYDPYVTQRLNGQTGGFDWLMNAHWGNSFAGMYKWTTANHPGVPIMLAEWGIGEKAGDPKFKPNLFASIPGLIKQYPALKAMVYFDKPSADVAGDVQVDTSAASLSAYRTMLTQLGSTVTSDTPENVAGGDTSGVSFVASSTSNANAKNYSVSVPKSTSSNDVLVLFVAQGSSSSTLNPGSGWTQRGRTVDGTHLTTVWTKTAKQSDAGSTVAISGNGTYSKTSLTLASYRGVSTSSPVSAIVGSAEGKSTSTHTTPSLSSAESGLWRLSYWSDKSNSTGSWVSVPGGDRVRARTAGTGSGRVSSLLTDAGPVSKGAQGSLSASTDKAGTYATKWTILLRPAS